MYSSPARCGETHDIEPEDLQEMARITLQDVTLEQALMLSPLDRRSDRLTLIASRIDSLIDPQQEQLGTRTEMPA
jgi:hypothetical protein